MTTIRDSTAMDTKLRQRIRYLRTEDGVQLAWAEIGAGPVLIKAANWLLSRRPSCKSADDLWTRKTGPSRSPSCSTPA